MNTFASVVVMLSALSAQAAPLVAPTEPLTPAQQVKMFKLPPGFEIQLVASEPAIQKPMNLNFDRRGRLWVTHSVEYPFAAKDADQARDGLTVLSDFGADGRANTVTRFVDKLNIPIGVQPMNRGKEAIVWSIPHIWKLADTDGDGKADKREILYGPFGIDDTHGNQNAFTLGLDGWVYACHGFRNHSRIKLGGTGDVVLELQSGNTYRFKPDGSAIEQYTHGQVNPFGLCFDPNGDIFTADCHSKPVTLLLRGGYYPSFGKPHDGLGFAPPTTNDGHGSTGIAGIAYVQGKTFPKEYTNCLYVGNPITNKIHRDGLTQSGSTYRVEKPVDFLTCDDPWFRPVDIQWGPDGALYIADFYNCIIGHYEVPLNHPRRDRSRGRIWRVVYTGQNGKAKLSTRTAFTQLTTTVLFDELRSDNHICRELATRELIQRGQEGDATVKAFTEVVTHRHPFDTPVPPHKGMRPDLIAWRAKGVWLNERLGLLDAKRMQRLAADAASVRLQLIKALSERKAWDSATAEVVRNSLLGTDAIVQRYAADALARHPDQANIEPLLKAWSGVASADTFLIHTIRMSLREQLRALPTNAKLKDITLDAANLNRLVNIALAVPTEQAAWFTFEYLRTNQVEPAFERRCMEHVAQHLPADRVDDIVVLVQKRLAGDVAGQWSMFEAMQTGLDKRGVKPEVESAMGRWLNTLTPQLLRKDAQPMWRHHAMTPGGASPWGLRERACADGKRVVFIDSIVNGEQLTGVLRSRPFVVPKALSFFMCGHNGYPGKSPPPVNHIRLVVDGKEVARQVPPRHDTARKYTWNLSAHAGKQGVIEIVDADHANAYAWIGVARFEPAVVSVLGLSAASRAGQTVAVLDRVGQYRVKSLVPQLREQILDSKAKPDIRLAAVNSLRRMADFDKPVIKAIVEAIRAAPARRQLRFANALCESAVSASALLQAIEEGKASPRLLDDEGLKQRFARVATESMQARARELLRRVPPLDNGLAKAIVHRRANYVKARPNIANGRLIFNKHCAACHRIDDNGATIAPALDGIANRGPDRLIEDILDPNRNVDQVFRMQVIAKKDGDVVMGFGVRAEGQSVVMSDTQGKAVRIAKSEVESQRPSKHSPMPGNYVDLMRESDFYDLLGFLLADR